MNMKRLFMTVLLTVGMMGPCFSAAGTVAEAENPAPRVIPAIREWKGGNGRFVLSDGMRVVLEEGTDLSDGKAEIISGYFENLFDMKVTVVSDKPRDGDIVLSSAAADGIPERDGYMLRAENKRITVNAPTEIGLLYGVTSVLQSCLADGYMPCGEACDYSEYEIRGGMLDVARAWIPLEYVEEITRYMAWFKLNEMHIHISDNEAFRLESDIPNLTSEQHYTKTDYRGYQQRMLEYGVEVITEIDTPAHSKSISAAVPGEYMLDASHLNIAKPEVLQFVKDLFDEYITGDDPVFVSTRVHIGTDEYPSGHSEEMRAYTDALLRHIRSRGYTPRFWGSFGGDGFNGTTPVTSDAEANFWAVELSDYKVLLDMGYDLINTCGPVLYIVPGGNYGFADYYNLEQLYGNWQVNYMGIGEATAIDPKHPQLKGGSFALWNDLYEEMSGFSVFDIFDRLRGGVCLMAEKTWCGRQTESIAPQDFVARYEALSRFSGDSDPGRHNTPTDAAAEDAGSIGWPYAVSADVTVNAYDGEVLLFDGADGTFYISESGKPGFRRGEYDFGYPCVIPEGETTHIQLIATKKETVLVINDTYYYEPINNRNSALTRSSTFVLPLETIGKGLNGKVENFLAERKTIDLNERLVDCNYALMRPVSVSGLEVYDGRFTAENAVDGDPATRLSFARDKDEQWLLIDLGRERMINRVDISFFEHISDYGISVSTDGKTFTEVARVKKGTDQARQADTVPFDMVSARYVRYEQHKRFHVEAWNAYYSGGICEISVYCFDEARYTSLLGRADALLNGQAELQNKDALLAARQALGTYLKASRRFTPHMDGLADALQAEISAAKKTVKGDVNGNDEVDAMDYGLAKRYVLGTYNLTEEQITRGDVNGNGDVDAMDYGMIKRHVLGTYEIK